MKRRRLAMLALVAVIAGCSSGRARGPNIVLIVIDTLRADHLPFYGYDKNTAPFMSTLAASAFLPVRAYATSSWTAPSTASIFTSLHPTQHGVLTGFRATRQLQLEDPTIRFNRLPERIQTLPEMLQHAGYRTFGVTDNLNIDKEEGFDRGFDSFANFHYEGAGRVNAQVLEWEGEIQSSDPYFLYIHYMDPHAPYNLRTPLQTTDPDVRLHTAYDDEIAYVDQKIRELHERFRWSENTAIIVTSDHGEELNDRGRRGHGETLYEEVLRVPLFVYYPDAIPPRTADGIASILDILPTVRALAGRPADPLDEGIDLLPVATQGGQLPDRDHMGHLLMRGVQVGPEDDRVKASVVRGAWKYIWSSDAAPELYDLASDPLELTNRSASTPDQVRSMQQRIAALESEGRKFEPAEGELPLDDKLLEQLKSLGYLR